jgi:hypothetical protein
MREHEKLNEGDHCRGQGLDRDEERESYTKKLRAVFQSGKWDRKPGESDKNLRKRRRMLLRNVINASLRRAGSLGVEVIPDASLDQKFGVDPRRTGPAAVPTSGTQGVASSEKNAIIVHPGFVESEALTDDDQGTLAEMLYHEGRHQEQCALAARQRAAELKARGRSPKQIRDDLKHAGVSDKLARYAARHPLNPKRRRDRARIPCAKAMWKSLFNRESLKYRKWIYEKQNDAKKKLENARKRRKQAFDEARTLKAVADDPTRTKEERDAARLGLRAEKRLYDQANKDLKDAGEENQARYADYRKLHHEHDAFKTSDDVEAENAVRTLGF